MAGPSAQQIAGSLSGGSLRELRKRIFFVITALIIFRIGTFIPVPGIDIAVMREIFDQQRTGILGMFNMFSGGALERMSIFAEPTVAIQSSMTMVFAWMKPRS